MFVNIQFIGQWSRTWVQIKRKSAANHSSVNMTCFAVPIESSPLI